ncbi:MAG: heavy metal translocating P-type ATPase [Phycisphaeraceae bacterium]|nr:heavy metal translocating P-type ATPase [Phycisphaeraceae bacterium]
MNEDCAHCGLPVPEGERRVEDALQFCCAGCRAIHAAITGGGLEDYYRRRGAARPESSPAGTARGHGILDADAFQREAAREIGEDLHRVELGIDGLHCGACVWLLERLPRAVPGLRSVRVNLTRRTLEIEWSPTKIRLSAIAVSIERLGYQVRPSRGAGDQASRNRAARAWLVRIAVAAAIAGNVMGISFALYGGMFTGMAPEHRMMFRIVSFALVVIDLAGPGRIFLQGAWTALRARTTHMDQPVALGLLLGTAAGLHATIVDGAETWFEAVAMLILLLLVGRWLQHRSQRKAQDEVERLFCLSPSTAMRMSPDDGLEEVPSDSLVPGDRVLVRSGDLVPADGLCESGGAGIDRSLLSGESRSIRIQAGEVLHAGEACLSGTVVMRVEAAGDSTRIAAIMNDVAEHAGKRPPIVQMADRLAGWFVSAVILLAGVTFAVWWGRGWDVAVDRTVALLIVTCPCALGLATPLAMVAAIGDAAARGMLIKGGETLERLSRSGTLLLDKTGTITAGVMDVVGTEGDADALAMAAAVETSSRHPIGRPIAELGDGRVAEDVREHPGLGIEGDVEGRRVRVGSGRFMEGTDARFALDREAVTTRGSTYATAPVWVAVDGVVVAAVFLGDPVRAESPGVVARIRDDGWTVGLLSGDIESIVDAVATSVGIEPSCTHADASPEEKVRVVSDVARRPVAMVGDGVNDAAAMAAADVGIAVHGGAEAALSTADVCLARDGLHGVEDLLRLARWTMRRIRVNIAVSIGWNTLFATLAISGLIGPILAAILMPISSASVVMLSLRRMRGEHGGGSSRRAAGDAHLLSRPVLARKERRRLAGVDSSSVPSDGDASTPTNRSKVVSYSS